MKNRLRAFPRAVGEFVLRILYQTMQRLAAVTIVALTLSGCMTTHRPISVLDALKSKIKSCCTRPKGRQQVGQISPITVTLTFNRDGSLASGPVVNNSNHGPMGAEKLQKR